jgi:predicted HNH restriction endonuclease
MNQNQNIITKTLTDANVAKGKKGMHDRYITVPKAQCNPEAFIGVPPLKITCFDVSSEKSYIFNYKKERNGEYRLTQFGAYYDDNNASVGDVIAIEKIHLSKGVQFQISLKRSEALTDINTYPDEIDENNSDVYPEGGKKTVVVNKYERNKNARKKCIDHHGAICACCGLDFKEMYGEIGEGYIHVHHIKPVSEIGESYNVDPIKDLIPVCPNCHAMIHRTRKAYTIQNIKDYIEAGEAPYDKNDE